MGGDPARPEELVAASAGRHGAACRLSAWRVDPGRDGVHLARERVPALKGDHQPRCAGLAGHDTDAVAGVRRHQPRRRSAPLADRSAHPARLPWSRPITMTGIAAAPPSNSAEIFEQAAPATKVRHYWESVGYRLRHAT